MTDTLIDEGTTTLEELDFKPQCQVDPEGRPTWCRRPDAETHDAENWLLFSCGHDMLMCQASTETLLHAMHTGTVFNCPTHGVRGLSVLTITPL